ncbi:MAG: hypothetical protein K0S32_3395 [Bacteroidetes bacterium]|nr:hypothetical protein [Bacteroidota bacterium]
MLLVLGLGRGAVFGQMAACPNGLVYVHANPIRIFNPAQALVPGTNPVVTSIALPTVATSGFAYGPNLNAVSPSPTFYTTITGTYYYWNGSTWVSTGHTTGNSAAINMAVGPGCMYNFIGSTGQVYQYNGTGNGSLLTTVSGFSSGGPFDIVVDQCCNFYVIRTSNPQWLQAYNSSGTLLATCTLSNLPSMSAGTGFAIAGNYVVVFNGTGVYVGTINGSVVTFTNAGANFGGGGSDLGSCPIPCNSACFTTLPVAFKNFYCTPSEKMNRLTWETMEEKKPAYYSIEHSGDGQNFTELARVASGSITSKYEFDVSEELPGEITYYRITSVDEDGTRKSTEMCYVIRDNIQVGGLYPNPANDVLHFSINSKMPKRITMHIIDLLGREIQNITQDIPDGMNHLTIDTKNIIEGVYFLTLTGDKGEFISGQKFIRQNK